MENSNDFDSDASFTVAIDCKKYDQITFGESTTSHIFRSTKSQRNICYMTAAIHMYANSLWLLWDSIKYFTFKRRKGVMILDRKSVNCK